MNKFAIITAPRSGSKYLRFLIACCKSIACRTELCHDKRTVDVDDVPSYIDGQINDPNSDWVMFNAEGENVASGFKVMYGQLNRHPEVIDYLVENDYKIIHLYRDNLLETYYSNQNAEATGVWHIRGDQKSKLNEIEIPPDELVKYIDRQLRGRVKMSRIFDDAGSDVLTVHYEDILKDEDGARDMICEFLNVENSLVDVDVSPHAPKRQRNCHISEVVSNYDEIVEVLKGGEYYDHIK